MKAVSTIMATAGKRPVEVIQVGSSILVQVVMEESDKADECNRNLPAVSTLHLHYVIQRSLLLTRST